MQKQSHADTDTRTVYTQRLYLKCKTGKHTHTHVYPCASEQDTSTWIHPHDCTLRHAAHTLRWELHMTSMFSNHWSVFLAQTANSTWSRHEFTGTCSIFHPPISTLPTWHYDPPHSMFCIPRCQISVAPFVPAPSRCQFLNSLCQTKKKKQLYFLKPKQLLLLLLFL